MAAVAAADVVAEAGAAAAGAAVTATAEAAACSPLAASRSGRRPGTLSGAGEMEEEDGEGAGAAEEQEEVDGGDEGSSQGSEDEDGTPSRCLEVFGARRQSKSILRGCVSGLRRVRGLVRNLMRGSRNWSGRVSIRGERECEVWEAGRSWLLQFEMWLGMTLAFSEVLVVNNGTRSGAQKWQGPHMKAEASVLVVIQGADHK